MLGIDPSEHRRDVNELTERARALEFFHLTRAGGRTGGTD